MPSQASISCSCFINPKTWLSIDLLTQYSHVLTYFFLYYLRIDLGGSNA